MSLLKVYNTTKEHLSNLSYFSISLIKSLLKEGGDAWEQNIFVEISLYDTRQTVQSEIINVDKTIFNIPNPEGVRITAINSPAKKEGEEHKCPRCDKDITLEEIKKTCTIKNNKGNNVCLIEDDKMIKAALPYLNQYRKKVGINTCVRKAHFLAQIAQESKFSDLEEGFNYYWEALINTFGAFQTEEGRKKAKLWGRAVKSKSDNGYASVSAVNQENIANWVYKNKNKNGDFNSGDGSIYRGRGFKQITWKSNYEALSEYFNKNMKLANEPNLNWVKNPLNLSKNPKDAIVSALAYWGKNNINIMATGFSEDCVKNVTKKINPALKGIDERIRFFNKAVDVLSVNDCVSGGINKKEKGSLVVIHGKGSKTISEWVVYKTAVYKNISIDSYKKLKRENNLPKPDYETFLARDAHGEKYGKHSDKRYGSKNETPPGEYYLIPGIPGQKYKIYISSDGKSAILNGSDGNRSGIAIHQYSPKYAIGCLTTVTGRDTTIINNLLEVLTDLPLKDDKPVRVIIEERLVKEESWSDSKVGTKKWTGIL